MTVSQNNNYRLITDTEIMPVDPNVPFNQGDLAFFHAGSNTTRPVASDADVATLVGTFQDTSPVAYHVSGSNDQGKLTRASVYVGKGMLRRFKIAGAGEPIGHLTEVYFGGDAQTVTTVKGAMVNPIGKIHLQYEEGQAQHNSVAGEEVYVMLVESAMLK